MKNCAYCNLTAEWIRKTQFSGVHYFCPQHAKEEEDFGKEDKSYFFWERIYSALPLTISKEIDEDETCKKMVSNQNLNFCSKIPDNRILFDDVIRFLSLGSQVWCQGAFARDSSGNKVSVCSRHAVSFCLDGAIDYIVYHKFSNGGNLVTLNETARNLRKMIFSKVGDIFTFNDNFTNYGDFITDLIILQFKMGKENDI